MDCCLLFQKSSSESGSTSPTRSFTPSDDVQDSAAVRRTPSKSSNWGGLNLDMTAREMREMIGSKKKKDPRRDERLDFYKKYEIIQTL